MKKVISFIIIFLAICFLMTNSYCVSVEKLIKNIPNSAKGSDTADKIAGNILAVVEIIGVAVATIMLVFVAIKYMTSAASDKAEIKKNLIPYLVGAIFVFGSMGIVEILRNFANQTLNK